MWELHLVEKVFSDREAFEHQGLFLLESTVDVNILHVGIVMFQAVIFVHLPERQGVDWCCTLRWMCENFANEQLVYYALLSASEDVFSVSNTLNSSTSTNVNRKILLLHSCISHNNPVTVNHNQQIFLYALFTFIFVFKGPVWRIGGAVLVENCRSKMLSWQSPKHRNSCFVALEWTLSIYRGSRSSSTESTAVFSTVA